MSIRAKYADGVFKPLEEVTDANPGTVYQIFTEAELRKLTEDLAWLKASEESFDFWNNEEDAVYDKL